MFQIQFLFVRGLYVKFQTQLLLTRLINMAVPLSSEYLWGDSSLEGLESTSRHAENTCCDRGAKLLAAGFVHAVYGYPIYWWVALNSIVVGPQADKSPGRSWWYIDWSEL